MRKTLPFLIAILLISLLVGCNSSDDATSQAITPIKLVPQRANLIAYAGVAQFLHDKDFAELYNSIAEKSPEAPATLEDLQDKIGGGDYQEGMFFADISEMSGSADISSLEEGNISEVNGFEGYSGMIIKGTFEENKVIAAIESEEKGELTTTTYNNHTIYTDSEEAALAFVGKDGFAIGTLQAVKDVIDIWEGKQSTVNGKILQLYNGLDDVLCKVAVVVPPEMAKESSSENSDEDMSALKDIKTVTLVVDKNGTSVTIDAELCFASRNSAEDFKGFVDDMAKLLNVEGLDVSLDGSCVKINLEMTIPMIKDMIDKMTQSSGKSGGLELNIHSSTQ